MKAGLLRFLECPECHGRLRLEAQSKARREIRSGLLRCRGCKAAYPIIDYIPRFVESDRYARSFSVQWNIFSQTQLDTGKTTDTYDTFMAKTGISPEALGGSVVLEAGCGMGRFLKVVSRHPSATVIGFDLSLAVDSAYRNIGSRRNVHIVQADIMKPPFRKSIFDVIYSIGVIHHTANPRGAFSRLVPLLKKNGQLAVWVYAKYQRPPLSDLYRMVTNRMHWGIVLALSRLLSRLYWLQRRWRYVRVIIPMSGEADRERRILDTFDWYSPKYQFKFTEAEVVGWFREMKLRDIEVLDFPVSVKGRR